jgi:hypothetical protein
MFALARYPGVDELGIFPASAMEHQRARGWVRVSEWRPEPADFYLPDFADAFDDLDAPPEAKPRAKSKREPEPQPEEEPESPAEPEKDEESE